MSITISVCSSKGGVGKTTCTRMLASTLRRKGYRVLMVDLVGLATLTKSVGAEPDENGSYRLLTDPQWRASDAVSMTKDGENLIRGAAALDGVAVEMERRYRPADQGIMLAAKLSKAAADYDFVLIDTPTAVNVVHMNALIASDWAVLAADPDEGSAEAVMQMGSSIAEAKAANPSLRVAGVLLSFADNRTTLTQVMRSKLDGIAVQLFGCGVFETSIRATVKMSEARLLKQDPAKYAPKCSAVQDYNQFTNELLKLVNAPEPVKRKAKR